MRRNGRCSGGFTLIEVLLVIALLGIILAVTVVSGTSFNSRRRFRHAVDRLETTLRMARADAANKVRRIRLTFDAETQLPEVLWEPEPLDEPQQFEPYANCSWRSRIPDDYIAVTRCRLIGPDGKPLDAGPTSIGDETEDDLEMQSITFNTDGSSDSVLIEIESTEEGDSLRAAIKLDGENSMITTRILYGPPEDDEEDPFADEEDEN